MHCLTRTSPKGAPFVGTCVLCGKTGLTLDVMVSDEECPNPRQVPHETAVMAALFPDKYNAE